MPMHFRLLPFAVLLLALAACRKPEPAAFWRDFQPLLITSDQSDFGPRGGYLSIAWAGNSENFTEEKILHFASEHGWTLQERSLYTRDHVTRWRYNDHPVFPLSHAGFDPEAPQDPIYLNFPRQMEGAAMLYTFQTGWNMVDPGTNASANTNGFVLLSGDGASMSVYFLWGE